MFEVEIPWPSVITYIVALCVPVTLYYCRTKKHAQSCSQVPRACPSVPILGNALAYKDHPDEFLYTQMKTLGSIFKINLAGLETTIVTSHTGMQQFAMAPESVLSSKSAVSDFGFRYTLGNDNVFRGTQFHKQIIKSNFKDLENLSVSCFATVKECLMREVGQQGGTIPDFLIFMRRIFLTIVTKELISDKLIEYYERETSTHFLDDFVSFQDMVEDATATAAVLPLWLALPVCLWNVAGQRGLLVKRLTSAVIAIREDVSSGVLPVADEGIWLTALKDTTAEETSEFIVGLLFAAHKNPAIAAFQTILYLLEDDINSGQSSDQDIARTSYLSQVTEEAMMFQQSQTQLHSSSGVSEQGGASSNSQDNTCTLLNQLHQCTMLTKSVMETLRLTAHSIGAVRKVISPLGWTVKLQDDKDLKSTSSSSRYHIPMGEYVGVSHIVPHRDSKRWGPDCDAFRPDRSDLLAKCTDEYMFTTFSHGVHHCPGSKIALLMVRMVVVELLSTYDITVLEDHPIPSVSFARATLAQRLTLCTLQLALK